MQKWNTLALYGIVRQQFCIIVVKYNHNISTVRATVKSTNRCTTVLSIVHASFLQCASFSWYINNILEKYLSWLSKNSFYVRDPFPIILGPCPVLGRNTKICWSSSDPVRILKIFDSDDESEREVNVWSLDPWCEEEFFESHERYFSKILFIYLEKLAHCKKLAWIFNN